MAKKEARADRKVDVRFLRFLVVIVSALLVFSLTACASGGETQQSSTPAQSQTQEQTAATPDADWNLPETIEMTQEATAAFQKAMDGLTGVSYEPAGYLGEKDGVYCILCRATVVYPDAKPYYALVYVNDDGVQNIWDIWMGAHAEKQ